MNDMNCRGAPPANNTGASLAKRVVAGAALLLCNLVMFGGFYQCTRRSTQGAFGAPISSDFVQPRPDRVQGVHGHYVIPLPADWQLRTEVARRRDNAVADQWISLPERDAHVLIIAETLRADQTIDMNRLIDGMFAHVRERTAGAREIGRGVVPGTNAQPYLEYEAHPANVQVPVRYIATAHMNGPEAIQFSAFFPASAANDLRAPVMALLRSVSYPEIEAITFPAGDGGAAPMTLVQAGTMAGATLPYELTLPTRMFLRSDAIAHAESPLIDRWLVLSFENAQLFTIPERDSAPEAPLQSLASAMIAPRRVALPDLVLDSTEAFPGRADGVLLRYHATAAGEMQHFVHALFRTGGMLVQLNGNCAVPVCPRYEPALLQIMRSLRVPVPLAPEPAAPAAQGHHHHHH